MVHLDHSGMLGQEWSSTPTFFRLRAQLRGPGAFTESDQI